MKIKLLACLCVMMLSIKLLLATIPVDSVWQTQKTKMLEFMSDEINATAIYVAKLDTVVNLDDTQKLQAGDIYKEYYSATKTVLSSNNERVSALAELRNLHQIMLADIDRILAPEQKGLLAESKNKKRKKVKDED